MKKHTLVHVCLIFAMLLSGLAWLPSAAGTPATAFAPAGTLAGVRYVKPDGTGNCSAWAAACDLQTALASAIEGDEIWVAAGVHYPGPAGAPRTATFQLKSHVAVYGGFEGTEASRFQRKPGANLSILSGDMDRNGLLDDGNAYHVVTGSGVDGSAILDGFIITSGHANSEPGINHHSGGGMFNEGASPTLTNLIFTGNQAVEGSGMFNRNSHPVLTNVTFSTNEYAQAGGGMFNLNSSPTLTNVTFFANSAGWGGGMYNDESSPTLTNVTFFANSATVGGGIYTESGSLTLANSILWGNTAQASAQINASTATITYSIIQGGGYPDPSNLDEYPEFVDPENGNLRLRIYSPAIDAGNNTALPAGIVTDLDGSPRFVDMPGVDDSGLGDAPVVDMGAYETQTIAPVLYVDRDAPGPIHDGKSWEQAFPRLESALAVASHHYVILASEGASRLASPASPLGTELYAAVNMPEIWVAGGVYYPSLPGDRRATFRLESGVAVLGGFSGVETAREQRSWRANPTTLSGDIDRNGLLDDGNAFHVVTGAWLAESTLLDGFTITAGNANVIDSDFWDLDWAGGGMLNRDGSNPTLANITFHANAAESGGGMLNVESSPTLTNVIFSVNTAAGDGGGMYNAPESNPRLTNASFYDNSAGVDGGGMYNLYQSRPTLTNVTLYANSAGGSGGGICNSNNSTPTLTNAILWGNTAAAGEQIFDDAAKPNPVSYSIIQGGYPGEGNLDEHPQFVDPANGNLRLRDSSPAIDAGNNNAVPAGVWTDLAGKPRFVDIPGVVDTGLGTPPLVDMGAFEFQILGIYLPALVK
jgi:hypothetical protein